MNCYATYLGAELVIYIIMDKKQIYWRLRRGVLELDFIFQDFGGAATDQLASALLVWCIRHILGMFNVVLVDLSYVDVCNLGNSPT